MRIFAISDLHTDFKQNWNLVEQLSEQDYKNDVLLIAGDISHNVIVIKRTLEILISKFKTVFFVPGNHELWVSDREENSIEKFTNVIKICKILGVQVTPLKILNCWILPLFSWYDLNFSSNDNASKDQLERWADFYFCQWPIETKNVDLFFSNMNEPFIKKYNGSVISFSHFLPRLDLLPSIESLRFKGLPKVAGSVQLEHQIRKLQSKIHVFGHSHINCDKKINGVRYIQNALSYPRERSFVHLPIKEIWQDEKVVGPVRSSY